MERNELIGIGVIAGFAATIGYAIKVTMDLKNVSQKMDIAVKDLVHKTSIDVPQDMLDRSIERAVTTEVRYQVEKSCSSAVSAVRSEITKEIKNTVNNEFQRQKDDVAKELKRKINNLDISSIRQEVIKEAKDTAAAKFKSDLDDILEKHNEELESVTRIYSSIADKLSSID